MTLHPDDWNSLVTALVAQGPPISVDEHARLVLILEKLRPTGPGETGVGTATVMVLQWYK